MVKRKKERKTSKICWHTIRGPCHENPFRHKRGMSQECVLTACMRSRGFILGFTFSECRYEYLDGGICKFYLRSFVYVSLNSEKGIHRALRSNTCSEEQVVIIYVANWNPNFSVLNPIRCGHPLGVKYCWMRIRSLLYRCEQHCITCCVQG